MGTVVTWHREAVGLVGRIDGLEYCTLQGDGPEVEAAKSEIERALATWDIRRNDDGSALAVHKFGDPFRLYGAPEISIGRRKFMEPRGSE
jgi:hypothetical protein